MTNTQDVKASQKLAPWWLLAFGVPVLFVSLSLLGNVVRRLWGAPSYNYDSETAQMLISGLPWGLVILVVLVVVARWSRMRVQGPQICWPKEVFLAVGAYLVMGILTFVVTRRGGGTWEFSTLAWLAAACFVVGFNEELTYRALSLGGFARKLPVFWAVAAAAVIFGLSHTVNLFSGSEPSLVARQVLYTTASGLFFGWLYVFSGRNLWLLIAIHAIHNFLVISPSTTGAVPLVGEGLDSMMNWSLGTVQGFVSAGLPILFTSWAWTKYRGMTLEQALGLSQGSALSEPMAHP